MKKTQWQLLLKGINIYVKYTILFFGLSILLDHYLFGKELMSDDIPGTLIKSFFMGFVLMIIRYTSFEFKNERKREADSSSPNRNH